MSRPPGSPAGRTILETPRLRLREMVPGEGALISGFFDDDQARRFYPDMFRIENGEAWVRRNVEGYARDGFGLWLLERISSGEAVGDCGLMRQLIEGEEEIEVGYHLHALHRGFGYVTEAAAACMTLAFEVLRVGRVVSIVHPENAASHAVARRIHAFHRTFMRQGEPYHLYYTDRG